MKEGFWINAKTGEWFEIDDHALWIRREANARKIGLPEETLQRIQRMPLRDLNGPDRRAILLVAMGAGLVRVRGHYTHLTVEGTLPVPAMLSSLAPFLARICGPFSVLKVNKLPDGPFYEVTYRDLAAALDRGDLAALFPPVEDPLLLLDPIRVITPEEAGDKADRLLDVSKTGLAPGEKLLP